MSRFPVVFRPPAFASWSSVRPPGGWAFLTVGLPGQRAGPRRGYRVSHARAATGVGAPYTPRAAVLSRLRSLLSRRRNDGLNWPHCDVLNWPHRRVRS